MCTKPCPAQSRSQEGGRCLSTAKMAPPRQPICQCDVPTPAYALFASGGFCTLDLLWTWPPEVTIWELTCWGGFESLRPGLEDTLRYSSLQSSLRAPTCSPHHLRLCPRGYWLLQRSFFNKPHAPRHARCISRSALQNAAWAPAPW